MYSRRLKQFKLFLLILLTAQAIILAQVVKDIMPVVKVTAGQTDSVFLPDMFYSEY